MTFVRVHDCAKVLVSISYTGGTAGESECLGTCLASSNWFAVAVKYVLHLNWQVKVLHGRRQRDGVEELQGQLTACVLEIGC